MKKQGHIYIINQIDSDFYKIGFTGKHPEQRLRQLQTGNPNKLELLFYVPGTRLLEYFLHQIFENAHVSGEWFKTTRERICLIEDLVLEEYNSKDRLFHQEYWAEVLILGLLKETAPTLYDKVGEGKFSIRDAVKIMNVHCAMLEAKKDLEKEKENARV